MKLIFAKALSVLVVLGVLDVHSTSRANSPLPSLPQYSSPTETMKTYYEAMRMRDVWYIKQTLSVGSLKMLESFARAQDKTLDESIVSGLAADKGSHPTPEMRSEKIDGDKATIEVKEEKSGKWEKVPFVKEDDNWKIALDEMFREAFKNQSNINSRN